MRAVNPDLCSGIIGAYDLVQSGTRPCFTPGPISDLEVREQLGIGAEEFKKRCPDITYYTQDPEIIKRCYFAYNAGMGAAATLDANNSAYVMNNYDDNYRNMVYQDVVLGTVRVTQLGAWPTHLAMQSLITSQLDLSNPTTSIAILDTLTRVYDWLNFEFNSVYINSNATLDFPEQRNFWGENCLVEPSDSILWRLRPNLNPVTENPILTQDVHGCRYALPGIDISSRTNRSAVLQAPMPGKVTTFTDQWYNSTIRIENDDWVVLMLHPRSYLVSEGTVSRGQAIGIMGAIGNATGPHVHYTIYDKNRQAFVDPADFLP
ncbi:MAG: M23 family metallopeptidase [Anaerolineales bacterium]|nr:M23 family metallopeptidase [Anaerolineales bacterium]